MKFKFIDNIDIDVFNWQQSILAKSYGIDWSKYLPADIAVEDAGDTNRLKAYLEEKYYKPGTVAEFKKWLKSNVKPSQIEEDLEELMGKNFTAKEVAVRITTFNRAPYDVKHNFFYTILRSSNRERAITNIYHELMHFLFHIYYWDECEDSGLSNPQIHDLKESLTVLLNPILEKRGFPLDMGYPNHQELRAKLRELWEKEKSFEPFLKKVLKSPNVLI